MSQQCGVCGTPVATVCVMCYQKQRDEIEQLRAALEKHHELLTDEPDDLCRDCGLAWNGTPASE